MSGKLAIGAWSHTTYGGLLNTNVPDNEVLDVQALGVGVRLGVLQEASDELDGLFGPAT
jgi:hypothetical protein